jgi:hypothetical protein
MIMTYDAKLIDEGLCPELVMLPATEDFPATDGRCLQPIVPGGYACPAHTEAIEAYLAVPLEERWAQDAEAEMYEAASGGW